MMSCFLLSVCQICNVFFVSCKLCLFHVFFNSADFIKKQTSNPPNTSSLAVDRKVGFDLATSCCIEINGTLLKGVLM